MSSNNDRDLASIIATLTELTKAVEAIRGGETEPELDPNDPLNEVLPSDHKVVDSSTWEDDEADRRLEESGEPRTVRNLLKAMMERDEAEAEYYLRSPRTHTRYRILRVLHKPFKRPDGTSFYDAATAHFAIPANVSANQLVGTTYDGTYKILETYESNLDTYFIVECL